MLFRIFGFVCELSRERAILCIVLFMNAGITKSSYYTMSTGSLLNIRCSNSVDEGDDTSSEPVLSGPPGPPGKKGPQGPQGVQGPRGLPGEKYSDAEFRFQFAVLGLVTNPAASCREILRQNASASNGLYYIKDLEGSVFQTYCDMTTAGGGWTLVASVHENNMKGRCTTGDRWSSEQGNSADHPHGDGLWENRAIHGAASSSTSDDYKNSGYFALNAEDVMLWHVPNDTPVGGFERSAFFKYYTHNGFLQSYGGNLGKLFSAHFNMRSKRYRAYADNGPAIPIRWDRGSNDELINLVDLNVRKQYDAGYIQFRVINYERNAFALCHGFRVKLNQVNVEHSCIGSTSNNIGHTNEENYCGDFSAKDWPGYASNEKLITSVVMIFYR